ncbi:hypothetical protein O181_078472 [Austropuccinia psidii MF-1]|uniref:Integrase catalytic domain-containing protein n=1 Tax=Austropuccinia psidii MF-1 TaxID=1389203 RepID=A0A9Q3FKE8_9BASI|nr:hypothetical protein [Austropuccinia psidii MF-1]
MKLFSRSLINTILHYCNDTRYYGNLSERRKIEGVRNCSWWPSWREESIEYFHTCGRFHKENRKTRKKFGLMIHIQEPKLPLELVHSPCITELPPVYDRTYNSFLAIVERYSKTPIFLPFIEDDTAMYTALLLWNRIIYYTVLFKKIISERYPKFTSALWTNLHRLFGTKSSFSTAYHPKADGPEKGMIQTLEDMIRRFCAYGLELKYSDGLTHDLCTFIPELGLEYKENFNY